MVGSLLWVSLTGCSLFGGGGDDPAETGQDEEEDPTDSATAPTVEQPMQFSAVQVVAVFRYDGGLPGPWSEDGNEGISAIEIVVGDDQYTGASGTACVVQIPISPDGARLVTDLEPTQFWGVQLSVSPEQVTTNCQDPQFQEIWDFYDGQVVEFVTTNRDGTPAEFGLIVQEPIGDTFSWIAQQRIDIDEEVVLGGIVRLSDRWPLSRTNQIFALAVEVDEDGNLIRDSEGDNVPVPLEDVFVNPGIANARYSFLGHELVFFTP